MKNSWLVIVMCAVVLPAAAQTSSAPVVEKGKMLVAANGARLGTVQRVSPDGGAQVIVDGRMVAIPGNTLSATNGKLTTSLTKSEVLALH